MEDVSPCTHPGHALAQLLTCRSAVCSGFNPSKLGELRSGADIRFPSTRHHVCGSPIVHRRGRVLQVFLLTSDAKNRTRSDGGRSCHLVQFVFPQTLGLGSILQPLSLYPSSPSQSGPSAGGGPPSLPSTQPGLGSAHPPTTIPPPPWSRDSLLPGQRCRDGAAGMHHNHCKMYGWSRFIVLQVANKNVRANKNKNADDLYQQVWDFWKDYHWKN